MARDCIHGSLARSCEVCELEGEVDRLRAERDEALARHDRTCSEAFVGLIRERDRLRGLLGPLASLAEEAKRHVPHDTDLRSDLDADLAGVRALLDDQEDTDG